MYGPINEVVFAAFKMLKSEHSKDNLLTPIFLASAVGVLSILNCFWVF